MRYPAYPRYKPSGVEWLGDVPEHWQLRRLKDCGNLVAGAGFPPEYQGHEAEELPFYKVGDLVVASDGKTMGAASNTISRETSSKLRAMVIPIGSILYAKIGAALFLNRRRVTSVACCIDNNMTAFVPDKENLSSGWSLYWMDILDFGEFANPGAVPSLSEGYQSTLPLLVPPKTEQATITSFLDMWTSKIDTLISKKRDLIEKLNEKRVTLISRTVTSGLPPEAALGAGLDPHPKLKPSGVDWLGDVPEHWDVMPLKWKARCFSGDGISADYIQPSQSEDAPYAVIGGNGRMGFSEKINTSKPVLAIGRVGALCGNVHIIEPPVWITDNALVLETFVHNFDLHFLSYVLASRNLNELAAKTAQPLITGSQVRDQRVPYPPLSEQSIIAEFLGQETVNIDQLVIKVKEAIERLQKYRTALIAAAVTGKIDVRGVTA